MAECDFGRVVVHAETRQARSKCAPQIVKGKATPAAVVTRGSYCDHPLICSPVFGDGNTRPDRASNWQASKTAARAGAIGARWPRPCFTNAAGSRTRPASRSTIAQVRPAASPRRQPVRIRNRTRRPMSWPGSRLSTPGDFAIGQRAAVLRPCNAVGACRAFASEAASRAQLKDLRLCDAPSKEGAAA